MPRHHPDVDLLISYAAGSLAEPVALLVATHLALCPECRIEMARMEALGGALLDELETRPAGTASLGRLLARLDESVDDRDTNPGTAFAVEPRVPRPLRDYLGVSLDALPWQSLPGLEKVELLAGDPVFRTRLMRIEAGTAMPLHSHEGHEFTLVLAGGFSDDGEHFLPGDVAFADASVNHRPLADPGADCLCLAVTDAPLHLTGPVGRFLNPVINF